MPIFNLPISAVAMMQPVNKELGGVCEWCAEFSEIPPLVVSIFTEGKDNWTKGPWQEKGFPQHNITTVICRDCLFKVANLRRHMRNKKAKEIYLEIRTNLGSRLTYPQEGVDFGGVVPFTKEGIQQAFKSNFRMGWIKIQQPKT